MKPILPRISTFTGLGFGRVYLLHDDEGYTVVDTSIGGADRRIMRQLAAAGVQPHEIRRILITHAHPDHIGGLAGLKAATGAQVYAHRLECPVIEAGAPMLRPDPATLRFPWTLMAAALPSQAPADAVKTPVYARLEGGETLNVAGGLHVLHTPGHAPGHLAFWLPEMRTLITGDVFFHTPGVQPPFAAFTPDRAENARSAHRLAELPAERVLFGHGLPILRGGQAALRASLHRFAVR